MNREELIEKINTVLADEFEANVEDITANAPLMDTLDMDSLDLVDVVVLIDSHFGITLVGTDFVGIKTFEDFYNLIEKKLGEKQ